MAVSAITAVLCVNVSFGEPSTLESMIRQLESPNFQERIRGRRELATNAATQLDEIARLASNAEPEIAEHLVKVLESVFLKHDDATGEQAERILQQLAEQGGTAALPAGEVLRSHAKLRESRARVALEKLGAQFVYYHPERFLSQMFGMGANVAAFPEVGVGFGPPAVLFQIYLHNDWTGTREDLWHLTRLSAHRDLVIYSIKGNSIDINDLFRLAGHLKGLSIHERGACLGISSGPDPSPCVVGEVVRGGAAEEAGLMTGDIVEALDGKEIRNFAHLVQTLQDYKIGDQVNFTVTRSQLQPSFDIQVELGSWRNVTFFEHAYVEPPPLFHGPLGEDNSAASESDSQTQQIKNDSES